MSFDQSDDLCAWRRSCLLVESLKGIRLKRGVRCQALLDARQLSVRSAALIAKAGTDSRTDQALNCFTECASTLQGLLAQLIQLDLLGHISEDEAALLQSEAAQLCDSVTKLIRSLRSSD